MDGAEKVSGRYRSIAYRADIGASLERVWRAFTDSAVLQRWTSPGASVVPREKGRMHVVFGSGLEMDAHIDVLVPGQRMRLILLPTPGMPGTDAVIIEDFLFERAPPGAVIRLLYCRPFAGRFLTSIRRSRSHGSRLWTGPAAIHSRLTK